MKILVVDDDDGLRSFLARELEQRGFGVMQTHFGDGGLSLYKKDGPWEFVLSDYKFIPGPAIKDGVQLLAAIRGMNRLQPMALMTSDPKEARKKLPQALQYLPVIRKPFRLEQVLHLLRQPILPL